jgi:DegV family protein with EDD domain
VKKVAIMTDTVSYMSKQVANAHDVTLVSTHVIINGKSNRENEIDLARFYEQLPEWKKEDKLPTTSSPSTDDFLQAYRKLSRQAQAIVYIGYSPKLGMAISAASQAKALVQDELPKTAIEVIDSQTACGTQMLVAIEAARAAAAGSSLSEVVAIANDLIKRVTFILISDDLYYLAKGGRIHKARPWASSKITNTVLLEMDAATGGEHTPLARCKTKGQTLTTLFDIVKQRSGGKKLHIAINHADALAEAEELKEKALAEFQCEELFISNIGPLVTTHTGLGTRIFSWWHED